MLEEEPLEEVLRERTNYYSMINKKIDFWLITDPSFLKKPEFSQLEKSIHKPIAAIVSTNRIFIDWIKLRIGYVFVGEFEENSIDNIKHELSNIK
uniref:hypothetical protein n=1 Tax=Erythrolobus coxiae TaxID=362235 RepID=UPI001FCD3E2B|nr:hypothetical protein MW556_pgp009 [Erythrolobus coxiae]UNJ17798.1 hypothetical protein [Erythrolobus coxiae]